MFTVIKNESNNNNNNKFKADTDKLNSIKKFHKYLFHLFLKSFFTLKLIFNYLFLFL